MKHAIGVRKFAKSDRRAITACQSLKQIILHHVGDIRLFRDSEDFDFEDDWEFSLPGLLLRGYRDGPICFAFTDQQRDLRVVKEARELLEQYHRKVRELSVAPLLALSNLEGREVYTKKGVAKPNLKRLSLSSRMRYRLDIIERLVSGNGASKRVDWHAAAVAAAAAEIWERKTERSLPKVIHADAPGPFGRFLTDVLECLWAEFEPDAPAPSARSAMRALANITNSGVKFRSPW